MHAHHQSHHVSGRAAVNWRQVALLTLGAVAIYAALRKLPTGTNLHPVDFSTTGKGALEMCDPTNPQFIPVVAARSPVTMSVTPAHNPANGYLLRLLTSTGKPIGPADLLETHTRKLHLLIVDPTLADYQHLHPRPTPTPGEWQFEFTPRLGGTYRVFSDFTPAATARGLYASTDLAITLAPAATGDRPKEELGSAVAASPQSVGLHDGLHLTLTPSSTPIRAGQSVDLVFTASRTDGHAVTLEPVMGALAHLVAFDVARSGFAHLHPNTTEPPPLPDATNPRLMFKLTLPEPGRYVIWAQLKQGGHEIFAPFWFEVTR